MKQPGPDHPITIEPNPHRVRVIVGGVIVAETTRALTLKEAQLPPVQYIPRQDAQMDLFERTEHKSHCPYKGDAAYYTLTAAASSPETRCGPTSSPTRQSPRSPATSPSTPARSTRSRS